MSIVMAFFGVTDKPFMEQIQSGFFWILGYFVLGYSSWRSKIRREGKK